MSRCAVLIDGGYLDKVIKNEFPGAKPDLGKLGDECARGIERLRTYYYHCPPYQGNNPTEAEKQRYKGAQQFFERLKKLPRFEVRLGKLQKIGTEYHQKRVDILMAVDLVRMSTGNQITHAVVITGDSDLVPAIEVAKDAGVVVQLYYSQNSIHSELLQACDETVTLTKAFIEKVNLPVPTQAAAATGGVILPNPFPKK